MTFNILKLELFKFLEFIKSLTAPLQNIVETHQFNVIYHLKNIDNYMFNKSTCTLFAPFSKICRFLF